MGETKPRRTLGNWRAALAVFLDRRTLVMLGLGFAAGLPNLLIFDTLSAWLREAGLSLETIGFFSLATLAYAFKFLWAPLVDRTRIPALTALLGHRRSWMLVAQAAIVAGLWLIALSDPAANLPVLAMFAVFTGFVSATQDIVIDAWRIEAAPETQQGAMAAAYQWGYRIALIVAGAVPLVLAQAYGWSMSYGVMACLMAVGVLAVLAAPREQEHAIRPMPARITQPAQYFAHFFGDPLADFFARFGRRAALILALICCYRISDFVLNIMNPFYLDLGFSLVQIAEVRKIYGVVMSMLGVFAGGYAVARWGIVGPLVAGAAAGPVTNLVYCWLTTQGPSMVALTVAISVDNVAAGFAGTCLIAYMSSLTTAGFTATQYALFSSLYALPGKLIASQSGTIVERAAHAAESGGTVTGLKSLLVDLPPHSLAAGAAKVGVSPAALGAGYIAFFVYSCLIGLLGLALAVLVARRPPAA
jgi:PAT family beta-lactamase induction signal transducer AmpG